jgi:transposase
MRGRYPSDITKEQFEEIREILESARKKTRPRTVDLHDVFNGLLYVLKTGCQWSALPHDYPKYKTVHSYFMKWSEEKKINRKKQPSVLERALKKIGRARAYEKWKRTMHEHGYC